MIDEGPSQEDLERFADEHGHCPECGAVIWDQADVCPECGASIVGGTSRRGEIQSGCRQQWILLIVAAVLVGLLIMYVF